MDFSSFLVSFSLIDESPPAAALQQGSSQPSAGASGSPPGPGVQVPWLNAPQPWQPLHHPSAPPAGG